MDEKYDATKLSIDELAERAGIPTRTIRYYITTRLITGPTSRGKQASYGADHLLRLRLIRKLTARHVPLEEIAERLDGLTTADVEALLAEADDHTAVRESARSPSPRAYIESLLRGALPNPPPAPLPARVVGHQVPSRPPVASPAQAPIEPAAPLREQGSNYQSPGASPPLLQDAGVLSMRSAEMPGTIARESAWKHWELAPGLELHVEVGREATYKALIDAMLRLAAEE
jgi:DNA-binding transcriptional MerR regulator